MKPQIRRTLGLISFAQEKNLSGRHVDLSHILAGRDGFPKGAREDKAGGCIGERYPASPDDILRWAQDDIAAESATISAPAARTKFGIMTNFELDLIPPPGVGLMTIV